jgi:hypothetical protein
MANVKENAVGTSAGTSGTNQDKYEEKVMLLQLRGVLDYDAVKRAAQNGVIRVREADTETPLVQVLGEFSIYNTF